MFVGLQLAAENSCLQEHVSIRLLAQRANVNRGTAKRWWDRRNELLVSVCSVLIQDMATRTHGEALLAQAISVFFVCVLGIQEPSSTCLYFFRKLVCDTAN